MKSSELRTRQFYKPSCLAGNKYYHIYNRGNNKENIFINKENYTYFLKRFHQYLSNKLDVYSYCLMPNHFHFLVKIKSFGDTKSYPALENKHDGKVIKITSVEKAFKDFFISYSKSFNKMHQRTGSLFQYKFKRKLIEDKNLLKYVTAYIHQNPVRWGLVENEDQWEFSSYNSILNNVNSFIRSGEVLKWFNGVDGFVRFHKEFITDIRENDYIFNSYNERLRLQKS